jgi:hypothetical protein
VAKVEFDRLMNAKDQPVETLARSETFQKSGTGPDAVIY